MPESAELNADLRRLKRELESGASTRSIGAAPAQSKADSRRWPVLAAILAILIGALLLRNHLVPVSAPSLAAIKLVEVTTAEGLHGFPTWSPDSRRIAYSREVNGFKKVFIKPLDAEPQQITCGNFDDIQPRFTPNGDAILFVRSNQPSGKLEPGDVFGKYDAGDIWKKDLASDTEGKFIENAFDPSFSPDGKLIAVDASWAGPRRIWVVDAQGHNPQQMTSDTSEAVDHLEPN